MPGLLVTVQTSSSTTFGVDSDGVTIPPTLTFTNSAGLVVGQTVEIHPTAAPVFVPGPTTMPIITVSADSVTLEPTQIAGVVGTVNATGTPPNFTLMQLSPVLAHANVSLIDVDTTTDTVFIDVSGIGAVHAGRHSIRRRFVIQYYRRADAGCGACARQLIILSGQKLSERRISVSAGIRRCFW